MTRRLGLAAALCLTTIVGFAVIVLGREARFFGGGPSTEAQPLAELSTAAPTVTQPPAAPVVIEQYVYRDEYIAAPPAANNTSTQPPASSPNEPGDDDAPPPASPAPSQPPAAPVTTEFRGPVVALSGSSLTVDDRRGQATVVLSPDTNIRGGVLSLGVIAKVHSRLQSDGTLLATEIEVSAGGAHEEDD